MIPRNRALTRATPLAIALIGLMAAIAHAGPAPTSGAAPPQPNQQTESIHAPAVPIPTAAPFLLEELFYRRLAPSGPNDRGSILTDMGAGGPLPQPNALERAKLDMARAAIEASRAAGTLNATPLCPPAATPSIETLSQAKTNALGNAPPAVLRPDAASGVGERPPVQVVGPPGMTPAEIAKISSRPAPADPQARSDGKGAN